MRGLRARARRSTPRPGLDPTAVTCQAPAPPPAAGAAGGGVGGAHALAAEEVAARLSGDVAGGLSEAEAAARLQQVGANLLPRRNRTPYGSIALRQLMDPLVALLIAAVGVSLAVGERVDAVVIAVIVLLNGVLGFSQELAAERAVLALRDTVQRRATVVRGGREREVPADRLVPGDLVVLSEGERVPADGRLVRAAGLAVDESLLTGESVPSEKGVAAVPAGTALADRSSLVFAATGVTRGRGMALVTATGPRAEVARVAELAEQTRPPPTPLQRRLGVLTRTMVAGGLLITFGLAGARVVQGASVQDAFLLGVSVAVAAVPEGLAATVTIALALGARRMAARRAIVRRLTAVETLGSATVIASDKTGTLTQNRLRLRSVLAVAGHTPEDVLRAGVLASTARLVQGADGEWQVRGDPIEGAIVVAAHERGLSAERLRAGLSRIREVPFDAERKRMTIVYGRSGGRVCAYTKGAPEMVLARSSAAEPVRRDLERRVAEWAGGGLRVLAVAERVLGSAAGSEDGLDRDCEVVGLLALHDPLRPGAAAAVRAAEAAGLRVQILTGDHPVAARAVADRLGLPGEAVSARVTPREKLELVEALQRQGEVVAVTGDGVNDAPALRRADIGVAMGRSGAEAAREAADLVLTDDDFATLVAAIAEGRVIADNVRKFVAFLLSANLGEVLLFSVAVLAGLGVPMTVAQVLVVNVLTDGLPAVALARDPPARGIATRLPERSDVLFTPAGWLALVLAGVTVGASAIGAFLVARSLQPSAAQTITFAALACSELLVVFAVRSPLAAAWREGRNPLLLAAVAGSLTLLALAIYWPQLHGPLGTVSLDGTQLAIVGAFAVAPLAVVEATKAVLRTVAPGASATALRLSR